MNKTNELCEMELTADTEERLSVLKKETGRNRQVYSAGQQRSCRTGKQIWETGYIISCKKISGWLHCMYADEIRASCRSVLSGRGKRGHGYCCCREWIKCIKKV